jgi:hypothetical protein
VLRLADLQANDEGYYCPTRLASSLCVSTTGPSARPLTVAGTGTNADIAGGYIIVESNFKVSRPAQSDKGSVTSCAHNSAAC